MKNLYELTKIASAEMNSILKDEFGDTEVICHQVNIYTNQRITVDFDATRNKYMIYTDTQTIRNIKKEDVVKTIKNLK